MAPREMTRRKALLGGAGLAGLLAAGGAISGGTGAFRSAGDAPGPETAPPTHRMTSTGESTPSGGTIDRLRDPDDWAGWEPWGGTVSVAEEGLAGEASLRVAAGDGDSRAGAIFPFREPQDLSDRFPTVGVKWKPSPPHDKTGIGLRVLDQEGRKAVFSAFPTKYFKREGAWQRVPLTYRVDVSDADCNLGAVDSLGFYHYTGGDYEATYWIGDVGFARSELDRGAVMIHFDDAPLSAYETAYPILERHGVPATFNFMAREAGTEGSPTVEQLRELSDAGWDITAHPQYPRPVPEMDAARIRDVFQREVEFLTEHGFTPSVMAWPYGRWDAESVAIASEYFDLAFAGGMGPHAVPIAEGTRMLYPRVGSDDVAVHPDVVDRAAARNGLVCLTYHRIGGGSIPTDTFADVVEHVASAPVDAITATDILDG